MIHLCAACNRGGTREFQAMGVSARVCGPGRRSFQARAANSLPGGKFLASDWPVRYGSLRRALCGQSMSSWKLFAGSSSSCSATSSESQSAPEPRRPRQTTGGATGTEIVRSSEPTRRQKRARVPMEHAPRIAVLRRSESPEQKARCRVCPSAQTRQPPSSASAATTSWRRAGLEPIGLHECRHTFTSLLIAAGVNAKAITAYPRPRLDRDDVRPLRASHARKRRRSGRPLVDAYLERVDTRRRLGQLAEP